MDLKLTTPGTAQIVIQPDGRTQVNPTTVFPYQCIGQLTMQFPNKKTYVGTGTLIDPQHVLTCAHNLYSGEDGGYAKSVTFVPALNGTAKPYGSFTASRLNVPEEYVSLDPPSPNAGPVDPTQYLYDFGMVTLSAGVPLTTFPAPLWVDDTGLSGKSCYLTGYPGDKPAGTMWGASGPVQPDDTEQLLFYTISTYYGQSGSAVMVATPSSSVPAIVGVHVAYAQVDDVVRNFAVRLNPEVIKVIQGWT